MPSQLSSSTGCCQPCDSTPVTVNVPGPQGPAGTNGTNGSNGVDAYTLTTASFVIPTSGNTVTITLEDVSFIPVSYSDNIFLAIANAGYFSVTSVNTTNNTVVIKNPTASLLGLPNAAATTVIAASTKVSLAGALGPAGSTGPTSGNAPSNATYITLNSDPTLTNETALVNLSPGYLRTYTSSGSGVLTTDATIPVGSITGILPVAKGGLGVNSTPAAGAIPIGTGAGYSVATITAGTGLTVTNSAGGITIGMTSATAGVEAFRSQSPASITSGSSEFNVFASVAADFDTSGGWDSTNGKYIVKETGYYKISFICNTNSVLNGNSNCYFKLKKNGSDLFATSTKNIGAGDGEVFIIEFTEKITTGNSDYYQIFCKNASHPSNAFSGYFSVVRLSNL